ncbi:MAG TPA: caspase family protein [Vicinamibacterales bacterium]|nr:caspase family protein [Vicinamibacterales bacterium]
MTRRQLIALAAGAAGASAIGHRRLRAQTLGDTVGAARDLVYQALEKLSASAPPDQVQSAVRILRNALDQEPGFGDAHYYRHLCLKRLGIEPVLQRTHLEAAQRYESEALRDGRDPFVLAVPQIYESLPVVGQKWALVVGISRFQPKIGAKPLRFAANDADAFAAALRDPNVGRFPADNVLHLTNEAATSGAIKARLNTIARAAKPEDVVVVYISTHGSPRSADLKQVSYLYTYDTDATGVDELFGTALPMVEISSIISTRCRAQRTVAIFDTCHSGSGVDSRALSPEDMNRLRDGAGRYVLSSCEPDQLSYEDRGHGFFTASLIEQLRARQGCVRMKDLFAAVQTDVSSRVRERVMREQRPVMASSDNSSEIILGAAVGGASDACTA